MTSNVASTSVKDKKKLWRLSRISDSLRPIVRLFEEDWTNTNTGVTVVQNRVTAEPPGVNASSDPTAVEARPVHVATPHPTPVTPAPHANVIRPPNKRRWSRAKSDTRTAPIEGQATQLSGHQPQKGKLRDREESTKNIQQTIASDTKPPRLLKRTPSSSRPAIPAPYRITTPTSHLLLDPFTPFLRPDFPPSLAEPILNPVNTQAQALRTYQLPKLPDGRHCRASEYIPLQAQRPGGEGVRRWLSGLPEHPEMFEGEEEARERIRGQIEGMRDSWVRRSLVVDVVDVAAVQAFAHF
ncbi:hypothetical protein SAICODRAFT_32085 [Saitoella complicata NRRL Y-17804]|uniref:Uncharacterized protein n=1 Tax=Saitoella complicata (strain BCRC 22490 / CBS 7301 / JCM 7358 / NBRC 10748 / NRRL Y-17804) TaxID=698492 RepID=A0A0E9NJN3_SAICN|nr:uncharacterized protein SAICODRAFT_32085 [Saitoella complicata NRRL Y-17804]ODQ50106.1 hypothetical protein SAICODRAFT_32085 [Saitoella complicata NRRL Y-17804]GAO49886.1 hypothetical protein G7K_4023-t1 [Saitoella complicata NRRL Y-17804]